MKVVDFPCRTGGWRADELQQLVALADAAGQTREVTWETGATERGDPQFYLLGPAPDHDCMLCVSRLAQGYVLQDGAGRLIGEAPSLDRFAEEAARAALRGGRSFVARAMLGWITLRLTIEEKLEPIIEESEELLVRFAPQVAGMV